MSSAAARLRDYLERSLSIAEAQAYLSAPIDEDERAGVLELVAWFERRYPTPLDRLRYIDRTYRAWSRSPSPRSRSSIEPVLPSDAPSR